MYKILINIKFYCQKPEIFWPGILQRIMLKEHTIEKDKNRAEDVFGVLKNEQLSYYTNNPVIQEILNEIKKISKDEMVRKNIEIKKGDNN